VDASRSGKEQGGGGGEVGLKRGDYRRNLTNCEGKGSDLESTNHTVARIVSDPRCKRRKEKQNMGRKGALSWNFEGGREKRPPPLLNRKGKKIWRKKARTRKGRYQVKKKIDSRNKIATKEIRAGGNFWKGVGGRGGVLVWKSRRNLKSRGNLFGKKQGGASPMLPTGRNPSSKEKLSG